MGLTEHITDVPFSFGLKEKREAKDDSSSDDHHGGGGSTSSTRTSTTTVIATTTTTAVNSVTTTTIVTANGSNTGAGTPNGAGSSSGGPPGSAQTQSPPTQTSPPPLSSSPPNPPVGSPGGGNITTTTATPASSSPANLPSSKPIFLFSNPPNTTVCHSLPLSWTYTGQGVAMTLSVAPASDTQSASTLPSRILSTNVSSDADAFIWTLVDVKEGWYIAKAFDTANTLHISAGSSAFFVAQGKDISCLLTITSTQSTPTASQSPFPSSSSIPTGDIVGIVLGVTAGVVGLIAAFVFPRLRKGYSSDSDSPTIIKKRRPRLLY